MDGQGERTPATCLSLMSPMIGQNQRSEFLRERAEFPDDGQNVTILSENLTKHFVTAHIT